MKKPQGALQSIAENLLSLQLVPSAVGGPSEKTKRGSPPAVGLSRQPGRQSSWANPEES